MAFKFLGYCHIIALILHRSLGLKICVFYGYRKDTKERVLVHAGVVLGKRFIDELGVWDDELEDVLDYFKYQNQPYDSLRYYLVSEKDLKWRAILKRTGATRVSYFRFLEIKSWIRRDLIPHLKKQGV